MARLTFRSYRPLATAVALALVLAGAGPAVAQPSSLAQRLQLLEDKEAIHALLERFFEHQESGDNNAFAGLFAKDGEMVLRLGTSKKRPDGTMGPMTGGPVGGSARPSAAPPRPEAPPGAAPARRAPMRHILSNAHIEVKGDTATAVSRFTLLSVSDDNRTTRVGGSGRYFDKLVRENGAWKIQKRIIQRDLPLPEPGTNPKLD